MNFKKLFLLLLLSTQALAGNTNRDVPGATLTFKQITTPSSPASGYDRCYTKSDDKLYCKSSGGTETVVGGITALTGDVTASGNGSVAATVALVGGSSASNVHAAELLANAATTANTNSTIMLRSGLGTVHIGTMFYDALTAWNLGYLDGSKEMQSIGFGTSGWILTSNGTSAAPSFQAAPVSTTLTTKGDLQTFSTVNARQAVPGDYGELVPDSNQTNGWRSASYLTKKAVNKNYVQYEDFENGATTGWTLGTTGTLFNGLPTSASTPAFGSGASGNLSLSIDSSTPNTGSNSLSYVSSAATTAGNMVASSALSLDKSVRATTLSVSFTYSFPTNPSNVNASGTSSNSYAWAFYDVTNSAYIPVNGAFCINQTSGVGKCSGTVQPLLSTASFRLMFYNSAATSGAVTVDLDDFYIGNSGSPRGPPVTDCTAYTPVLTGLGTVTSVSACSYRVGDHLFGHATFTAGTVSAAAVTMTLGYGGTSGNVSVDTSKLPGNSNAGHGLTSQNSSTLFTYEAIVNGTTPTTLFLTAQTSAISANASVLGSSGFGSSATYTYWFSVPISGWSASTSLSSDASSRPVMARYHNLGTPTIADQNAFKFATKDWDTFGAYNTSTGGFTVPISGWYRVTLSYYAGATGAFAYIAKNGLSSTGGTPGNQARLGPSSVAAQAGVPHSSTVQANAGDILYLAGASGITITNDDTSYSYVEFERVADPSIIAGVDTTKARYYGSSTTITGSLATIVWTTKDKDSHGAMSSSGFTCPSNGTYSVRTGLAITGTHVLNNAAAIQIQLDGVAKTDTTVYAGGAVTTLNPIVSDEFFCAQNSVIRIQALSTATSPSLVANDAKNFVSIMRTGN